jgi:hypothetical protein
MSFTICVLITQIVCKSWFLHIIMCQNYTQSLTPHSVLYKHKCQCKITQNSNLHKPCANLYTNNCV